MRPYIRAFLVAVTIFFYVLYLLIHQLFRGKDTAYAMKMRSRWVRLGIKILGIEVQQQGEIPASCGIIVSNHRSMIDPIVILNYFEAFPVAKAEIEKYPLIGYAAEATGIIFLQRNEENSRKNTRSAMKAKVKEGYNVLIFPEGTTSRLPTTRTFMKGSFEIAAEEAIPIIPVAIEYEREINRWADGDSFWKHFSSAYKNKKVRVKLYIGEPLIDENGWRLLRNTQEWINSKLIDSKGL